MNSYAILDELLAERELLPVGSKMWVEVNLMYQVATDAHGVLAVRAPHVLARARAYRAKQLTHLNRAQWLLAQRESRLARAEESKI